MIAPFDMQTTLLISSAAGIISSYLAYRRGKNPIVWFFIGVLFGLFGVFALFFSGMGKKQQLGTPKITAPEPKLDGPINKFWYYQDATNSQVGPVSYNTVSSAWKKGGLSLTALVWHEDLIDWKPLQELIILESDKTPPLKPPVAK